MCVSLSMRVSVCVSVCLCVYLCVYDHSCYIYNAKTDFAILDTRWIFFHTFAFSLLKIYTRDLISHPPRTGVSSPLCSNRCQLGVLFCSDLGMTSDSIKASGVLKVQGCLRCKDRYIYALVIDVCRSDQCLLVKAKVVIYSPISPTAHRSLHQLPP